MLLYKDLPMTFIKGLKKGVSFDGSEIINIVKKNNIVSLTTRNGDVFNAHWKTDGFEVFVKRKEDREMRKARKKKSRKSDGG
jgi:hypothetical protein